MKIVTIVGARPQFIKAGTVSRQISKYKELDECIVHTGQHYDNNMSDIFFEEMKIPKPDYFLGVGGMSHGAMTGQMIEKIEEVLLDERPDWLLVYGDTNSTLAGALAATKLHIKIAHVEAGLRSFNIKMPEEMNRILTDRVSSLLFCPTSVAIENLRKEGVDNWMSRVLLSGDVMQDGAIFYKDLASKPGIDIDGDFILCTIHRAENTDDRERMNNIIQALNEIALDKQIVLPLHPRTRKILLEMDRKLTSKINIIDPIGYLNMVWLLDNCSLVLTDSGGLQKEAFFFSKPCVTLRDETEWVELVSNKFNVLVGANQERILSAVYHGVFSENYDMNLYGGGKAAENIIDGIVRYNDFR